MPTHLDFKLVLYDENKQKLVRVFNNEEILSKSIIYEYNLINNENKFLKNSELN